MQNNSFRYRIISKLISEIGVFFMKKFINWFIHSNWFGYFGLSLIMSPIYFYVVNLYQPFFRKWWFGNQDTELYTAQILLFTLGLFIIAIFFNVQIDEKKNWLWSKVALLFFLFIFMFSTWILTAIRDAYIGIIFFWPFFMILTNLLHWVLKEIRNIYFNLESYEKIAVIIPVITVLLNYILI